MALNDLLKMTFERKASDLHLKVGVPPILRVDGRLMPLETEKRMTQEDTIGVAASIMNAPQKARFNEKNELDMAYAVPGLGRFLLESPPSAGFSGLVTDPAYGIGIPFMLVGPLLTIACVNVAGLFLAVVVYIVPLTTFEFWQA